MREIKVWEVRIWDTRNVGRGVVEAWEEMFDEVEGGRNAIGWRDAVDSFGVDAQDSYLLEYSGQYFH